MRSAVPATRRRPRAAAATTKLSLVAYAVPKVGFDKVIPAFDQTPEGKGITFSQSYGVSGDQSRKVESGLPTDVVNFSVEPDVTRLVKAGSSTTAGTRTSTRASRSGRS